MSFGQVVAIIGMGVGIVLVAGAISLDVDLRRSAKALMAVVGAGVALASGLWLWTQYRAQIEAEDAAEWKVLRDRYGVTETQLPEGGPPLADDTAVTLLRGNRVVECRTYKDNLRLFCPVKGEPGTYAELPRKDR